MFWCHNVVATEHTVSRRLNPLNESAEALQSAKWLLIFSSMESNGFSTSFALFLTLQGISCTRGLPCQFVGIQTDAWL